MDSSENQVTTFFNNKSKVNCKVFMKINGSPEEAKVLVVRNTEELERYQ